MPNDVVDSIIAQFQSSAETARQTSQENRLSMYLDDYDTEILTLLHSQFHRDNYKRLYPMLANYYNLLKKIVNLKSVIYQQEAKRIWYKRDGKTVDDNYGEIIQNSNIHITMPLGNKITNVNNTSLIRIMSNSDKRIMEYEVIPSELISITQNPEKPSEIKSLLHQVVIQDSYTKLNALVRTPGSVLVNMNRDSSKYILKYFYWDKEKYIVLDSDFKKTLEIDNPYRNKDGEGIIPYVLLSNFPSISGTIWNETVNNDIYIGTLQVNVLQTYLNNLLKTSGYRQLFITGIDKEEIGRLDERASDPLQIVGLSSKDAKIAGILLSGNINEVKDCIHDVISEIADNHGISFSSRVSSAQKMSGLALQISQETIDNIREEQQPLYRSFEKQISEDTVIIANTDLKSNIDVEGDLSIDFYDFEDKIDPKDKVTLNNWYLSKNLKSIIDIYREIDPDCESDEAAAKRIEENKNINDEYTNSFDFVPEEEDAKADQTA